MFKRSLIIVLFLFVICNFVFAYNNDQITDTYWDANRFRDTLIQEFPYVDFEIKDVSHENYTYKATIEAKLKEPVTFVVYSNINGHICSNFLETLIAREIPSYKQQIGNFYYYRFNFEEDNKSNQLKSLFIWMAYNGDEASISKEYFINESVTIHKALVKQGIKPEGICLRIVYKESPPMNSLYCLIYYSIVFESEFTNRTENDLMKMVKEGAAI